MLRWTECKDEEHSIPRCPLLDSDDFTYYNLITAIIRPFTLTHTLLRQVHAVINMVSCLLFPDTRIATTI